MVRLGVVFCFALCTTGCLRRQGRNSDCRWPVEIADHRADGRHLSEDAELAEDLAIRYADTHHGLRTPFYVSGEAYGAARDACMKSLFAQIAKQHGVAPEEVEASLGHHRTSIDLAVTLPFALLYLIGAWFACGVMWRRYAPAEDGWGPSLVMAVFCSLVAGVGCTIAGEVWSLVAETYRLGNSHMSYRAQRLPWVQHRGAFFVAAVILFWVTASIRRWRDDNRRAPSTGGI
jgi:hypothetical protein